MRKMVYLPYVRFEQEEGEAEGIGWYFTQYNAETGEGRGWHGTEFMPDCLFETTCEGGEPETKFFDVNTNEPIKQWSWQEPPDDNAFTSYGSLDEFVANNSQKVFRVVDLLNEIRLTSCKEDMGYAFYPPIHTKFKIAHLVANLDKIRKKRYNIKVKKEFRLLL